MYENSGAASGKQAISWYNGNTSYYKARLWTQVGSGYNETTFGIDVADNARNLDTRLIIQNGNVGIGTISPSTILNVASSAPTIRLNPTTQNNVTTIEFGVLNAGTTAYAKIDATNTINYDSNLRFFTNGPGSLTQVERMRIGYNGNIGVGTTSPDDLLDATLGLSVYSSTGRAGIAMSGNTTTADEVLGRLCFSNNNSTNAGNKRLAYISGIRGTTNNSAYLEFGTANDALGTQRMVITQAGGVGIGTSAPGTSGVTGGATGGAALGLIAPTPAPIPAPPSAAIAAVCPRPAVS
jgi:hypothetical protein